MDQGQNVIAENPAEIGADTVISTICHSYQGPCAVIEASGSGRVIAVLPSGAEAYRVARYAITPDGGYGSIVVEETDLPVTHPDLESWV